MESLQFVILIVAVTTFGWVATTWFRAKHGYPLTDDLGNTIDKTDRITKDALAAMDAKVNKLQDRVKVLERITTDEGVRLADEIDRLKTLPEPDEDLTGLELKEKIADRS